MVSQSAGGQVSGTYGNHHENAKEMGSGDNPAFERVAVSVRGNAPEMVSESSWPLGEERGGTPPSPFSVSPSLFPKTLAHTSRFCGQ